MHQFILYGSVPDARHEQVLNILAGVCATQPSTYAEQHVLYAPVNTPTNSNLINNKRKSQQASNQRYYHSVDRSLDPVDHTPAAWQLLVKEEPEAGSPSVISQPYTTIGRLDISTYSNPVAFRIVSNQIISGHYFVHGNVVFKIFRILLPQKPFNQPLDEAAPSRNDLSWLDPSGSYMIEAVVRVEDRRNSKLADKATKELLDARKMLQGSIPLSAPDRLSLDTRVRDET